MLRKIIVSGIFIALFCNSIIFLNSCDKDKNPVTPHDSHNEAEGLVIKMNGTPLVIVKEGKVQQGKIAVKINEQTSTLLVKFYDADGDEFTPTEAASSLNLEISDGSVAEKVLFTGKPWEFAIKGKKVGQTTLLIKLMHGDHADFTAPAIIVEVIN